MNPVSFQINLAPGDYRHSKSLLEHQISTFHEQVEEIVLTYDKNPKKILSNDELENYHKPFIELIKSLQEKYPKVKFSEVDYSKETINRVSKIFFNKQAATHDFRGAPIYAYLFGIADCKYDYVLHIDSDMFFGGLSQSWIKEAIQMYESDNSLVYLGPLPGPPHPKKELVGQSSYSTYGQGEYSFEFSKSMSTRVVFLNRKKLYGELISKLPPFKEIIFAKT